MPMKTPERQNDELRDEYDFDSLAGGVRGKYTKRMAAGSNLVLLDPDVARAFPSDEAVNKALRMLAELAETTADR
jgi:hypothetical protein